MSDNTTVTTGLLEKAEHYGKTSLQLIKLQAVDRSAKVMTSLSTQIVIGFAVVLFIVFLNIGFALWIGSLTGKTFQGFFIMSGVIILQALLLYLFREPLIRTPVSNLVINNLLNQKEK